jgi:ABC-type methionine transport system ATPase subunit
VLEVAGISFNIGNALPLYLSIAEALGVAKIVYPIIDRKSNNDVDGITLDELNGTIEFSHVTFAYPSRPDVPVLSSLSFHIKPGQTIGLVGPSGGGKSSILQLIQKLYTHNEGLITIDGVDINELSVAWLREKIGVVSQDPILFNTTIGENIAYGKEGATHEEIVRAAKAANAYNFISLLPNNFNTLVGEGGSQLSGGQKQCIAIARALIRDPKILLLDEATSSLDTDSERIVQEALDKAREGRTTIMIAHRLATIQGADMILCINEGRIVEMGVHHQLMAEQGLYYKLVLKNSKDVDRAKEAPATNDIIRAYRHSTKVKASLQRRPSSLSSRHHPAHSTMAQATSIVSTLKRNRRPSAKQVTREASTMNFNKRIQDTGILSPVNEFSVPPTPIRTPKFSPQFDLDDVSVSF